MTDGSPLPLLSRPGVKRDGTLFDSDYHAASHWCRWYQGRPRKMGGYREIYSALDGPPRGLDSHPANNELYIHVGTADSLTRIRFNVNTYLTAGVAVRTPAGFATDANNLWQFDQMYDAASGLTGGPTYLLAHAAPNALDIASDTATPLYYGDIAATTALTAVPSVEVSGGVVSLFPYAFAFGSDGYLAQSVANQPANFTGTGSNQFRATSKKIVRGMPLRGGAGNSPSGLFFSLDSIIKASFVGGAPVFSYDSLSNQNGILSAASAIEHDGIYYWVGLGRFMRFNGVVSELPNHLNASFFFENLNWPYRNKVYAFKVARFSEIWWCFPKVPSTEPNHAVVLNLNEQTWYDTPLPSDGRSYAINPASYRFPLMGGVTAENNLYKLWQHEFGVDRVAGNPLTATAIRSYYETHELSLASPANRELSAGQLEPDFVQQGDMTVTMIGRSNARSPSEEVGPLTFETAPQATAADQFVNFKRVFRLMRFRFESNTSGGFYQTGKPLLHQQAAGGRSTS